MDPAALNDRIGRRVNLLRARAVDRASNLVLEAFAFHPDRNTVQSHLASQVDILSAREPHVLDKDAKFVAKVLEERVKIALEAERQQQTQQAQDRDDTGAGAFVPPESGTDRAPVPAWCSPPTTRPTRRPVGRHAPVIAR